MNENAINVLTVQTICVEVCITLRHLRFFFNIFLFISFFSPDNCERHRQIFRNSSPLTAPSFFPTNCQLAWLFNCASPGFSIVCGIIPCLSLMGSRWISSFSGSVCMRLGIFSYFSITLSFLRFLAWTGSLQNKTHQCITFTDGQFVTLTFNNIELINHKHISNFVQFNFTILLVGFKQFKQTTANFPDCCGLPAT